jgi:hypothetical protein
VHAHPRTDHFKEDIIQAFYDGIKHKPETTFGNVKADVLADKDPTFRRGNFCSVIRGSAWPAWIKTSERVAKLQKKATLSSATMMTVEAQGLARRQTNASRKTLDLIADKWVILVLFALRNGSRRFALAPVLNAIMDWSHGNLEKVHAARAAYEKKHKEKGALV